MKVLFSVMDFCLSFIINSILCIISFLYSRCWHKRIIFNGFCALVVKFKLENFLWIF